MKKRKPKVCSRGHAFYRSSDCPVCPKCWPGKYIKLATDLPVKLGAPAQRALVRAGIKRLAQLAGYTEDQISDLHGVGPSAMRLLKTEMRKKKIAFKK